MKPTKKSGFPKYENPPPPPKKRYMPPDATPLHQQENTDYQKAAKGMIEYFMGMEIENHVETAAIQQANKLAEQ